MRIEECRENNIEEVISPDKKSHILQAWDKHVNKEVNIVCREMRDWFWSHRETDIQKVNFNLVCGSYEFSMTNATDISNSYEETHLLPFKKDFPRLFVQKLCRNVTVVEL